MAFVTKKGKPSHKFDMIMKIVDFLFGFSLNNLKYYCFPGVNF